MSPLEIAAIHASASPLQALPSRPSRPPRARSRGTGRSANSEVGCIQNVLFSSHRNNQSQDENEQHATSLHISTKGVGWRVRGRPQIQARGWEAGAVGGPWINGGTVGRGVGPDRVDL